MSKDFVLAVDSKSPSAEKRVGKRKRNDPTIEEIEVDINAPEPPSKKALRKAKKAKTDSVTAKSRLSSGTTTSTVEKLPDLVTENDALKGKEAQTSPLVLANGNESKGANLGSKDAHSEKQLSKRSNFGVWIGNLPWSATKDDVRRFLTTDTGIGDGAITRVHMPSPSDAKRQGARKNKGFAYIDLSTKEALAEALSLSEALVSGRRVLIKDAKSFEGRPEKHLEETAPPAVSGKSPSKRIFIGNLGFDTTKEDIRDHFARCGEILNVQIATFEDSGKCKGYAWVDFDIVEAGHAAVRGWVHIEQELEDGDEDESSEGQDDIESKVKRKKPTLRKWWVNKLQGRPLRIEFAEDKTVRYKKRFGKNAPMQNKATIDAAEEFSVAENAASNIQVAAKDRTSVSHGPKEKTTLLHLKKRFDARTVKPGAALAAAPRLQGSIVAGQGKKTILA